MLRPREAGDLEHRLYIALPEATQRLTPTVRDGGPRQLYVRKKDLEKEDGTYDRTPGCKGCEALMVGLPSVSHNMTCRNRLMMMGRRSKEICRCWEETGRRNDEEGESRSNSIARSDGTRGEIVGIALWQPEEETVTSPKRNQEGVERGEPGKKARAKPNKGEKRVGESVDDLFHEAEGSAEPLVVSTGGSAEIQSEPPAALLQQREPRRDQQRQVRHSVTTSFGHQLYRSRRFGDKIQNKISRHCFTLEWSRKLMNLQRQNWMHWERVTWRKYFHHQDSQRSAKHSNYLLDTHLTWRQVGTWRTKHRWDVLKRAWMRRIRTWPQEAHLVIHVRFYRDWTKEEWTQRNSKQDWKKEKRCWKHHVRSTSKGSRKGSSYMNIRSQQSRGKKSASKKSVRCRM